MTEKGLRISFWLLLVALATIFILYFTDERIPYDCQLNEEVYNSSISSGVVVKKYIDAKNHANKTVILKDGQKEYTLLFVSEANSSDFDKLLEKDRITKPARSFHLKVNQKEEFIFAPDCEAFFDSFSEN